MNKEIQEVYPNKREAMRAADIWERKQIQNCSWTVRPVKESDPKKPWIFEHK